MDNTEITETTETKRKAGRPMGAKKRLGMSIEDRLKILESIARSKDPDIKQDSKISAIKQITELLADKIDRNERLLPVYRLEMVLDRKSNSSNGKETCNNKPVIACNSVSEVVKSQEPISLPDYNDSTQDIDVFDNEELKDNSDDKDEIF